ncbi:MAG: OmpA family protein [Bacteroidota bacterium]
MRFKHLLLFIAVAFLASCVSQRKYNDMYALWVYTDSQYQMLKSQNILKSRNNCDNFIGEIDRLRKDSVAADSIYKAYVALTENDKANLRAELLNQSSRLTLSAAKIADLEAALFKKDSIMKATRTRLTAALVGFADKGVNVHVVGGKVYISLDERLLFQSGKIDVNEGGKTALTEISNALNQDSTTVLTIEGHTDDIPYKGKAYKDNWDISVLRATSVVRYMQSSGIRSDRFIASGRAEFLPIDPAQTPEARKKNRRIEIIVTPNLDEIAKLLE